MGGDGQQEKEKTPEKHSLVAETIEQLPSAAADLARDAWSHKGATALHVVETVGEAAIAGVVLGHFIPARGPASWLIGGALTLPLVRQSVMRLTKANSQFNRAGVDQTKVAHNLAKDTLSGAFDLGLTFAAGWRGAEFGHTTAKAPNLLGDIGQSSQRMVLKGENELLSTAARLVRPSPSAERAAASDLGLLRGNFTVGKPGTFAGPDIEGAISSVRVKPELEPELRSGLSRPLGILSRRIDQYAGTKPAVSTALDKQLSPTDELQIYTGSLHGHSRYSDGMLSPEELFAKAKARGEQVTTITDHNHELSRTGVHGHDPRAGDEAGTPIITANPVEYSQTFVAAAKNTEPGKHVDLVGVEVGTIGKPGTPHHGPVGVNHFGLIEVPTFYESTVVRRSALDRLVLSPFRRAFGIAEPPPVVKAPDVVKIADGDAKAFAEHLANQKATDGGTPVINLHHPRATEELDSSLPRNLRFADYGKLSFDPKSPTKSIKLWFENFAKPYVRQMELIKGEALNPNPTDRMKPGDIDLHSYLVYMDKGLKASPTFGRDFHYGDPVGRPAGTIFLSRALDKPSILEALRARRTGATTSREKLVGSLWANDSLPMGSVLDQSAINNLSLKVKIGGDIAPDAKYTVKLLGDKIGDGKLADVVQKRELTGQELLDAGQTVEFEPVQHTLGNRSAFMAQVDRVGAEAPDYTDHMWTAPIWIEPPAGATHNVVVQAVVGAGANALANGLKPGQ